jgi:hypothetical protein
LAPSMFTVRLNQGVFTASGTLSAKAATLAQALGFIGEFAVLRSVLIEAPWVERHGRYVMDVYDWCDCWFSDPPVMAQVIAPPGFTPGGAGSSKEVGS